MEFAWRSDCDSIAVSGIPSNAYRVVVRSDSKRPSYGLCSIGLACSWLTTAAVDLSTIPACAADAPPAKSLLLDARVVESTAGVRLQLGQVKKDPANPLMGADRPWEVRLDNLYPNVLFDEGDKLFKCWYALFLIDVAAQKTSRNQRKHVSYNDARKLWGTEPRWPCATPSRPTGSNGPSLRLGVCEFQGSKDNNIVVRDPSPPEGRPRRRRAARPARSGPAAALQGVLFDAGGPVGRGLGRRHSLGSAPGVPGHRRARRYA